MPSRFRPLANLVDPCDTSHKRRTGRFIKTSGSCPWDRTFYGPFRWDRTFYPQGPDGICYHVRSSNRGPDAIHKTPGPFFLLFLNILGWSAAAGLAKATPIRRRQSKAYRLRDMCARRRLAEDGRPKKAKEKSEKTA